MPIYEYECLKCGTNREVMQKMSEPSLAVCPVCGGEMKKLISSTSFVLKGGGWYVTDYASGDRKRGMDAEKGDSKEKTSDNKNSEKAVEKTSASAEAGKGSAEGVKKESTEEK
jgi:putative FmdB family regulatory protein